MRRHLVAFFFLVFGSVAVAAAADETKPQEIASYSLANGLKVVLVPDRRVPKIVMNLRYRVGSMNEPAGRSGFAHLFEHLMFSGTKAWPNVFGAHSAMGNTINAWTQEDGTVYYVEGLSSGLPTILAIEADRMANLGENVDQRKLDLQRNVVKNEMRQNVLDSAGASGWYAFWAGLFPKDHPYSRAVIGSIPDLDEATLTDVQGFFNTYYVPNNAVLVVVGDFDVADAKAIVEDTFGRVPRGADVARPAIPAPSATKLRLEVTDRVPTPRIMLGFSGPSVYGPENGDLAIASDLLGNGVYGVLRDRLVSGTGLASSVGAWWTPGLLGGRLEIDATANEGVSADKLEAELRKVLAEFLAAPIDAADVNRAKSASLLSARLGIEPLSDRASAVAYATDAFDDPQVALVDDPQIVAATPETVAASMKKVLVLDDSSTVVIRPGDRGDYPAVLTQSSGTPKPFNVAARPQIEIPKLAGREPGTTELPEKSTATLSNGSKVVHYQLSESPMEYVAAVSTAGWSNAPEGKEGLIDIAANMAVRGAGDRNYTEMAKLATELGISIGASSDNLGTSMTMFAPKDKFADGIAMLSDVILRPRFDPSEWTIAMKGYQQWLADRESDLPGVASRAADKALFPKVPGRVDQDWSFAALNNISLEDAKLKFKEMFKPASTVFYSVGSQPIEDVVAGLEKSFGSWKDDGTGLVGEPIGSPSFPTKRRVLLVPEPGASQSALYIARPAPGRDDPGRAESTAVMRLLGDDFNSRLNSVIREEKGYTYGVSAALMSSMRNNGGMIVEMTVDRANTGAALSEVFKGFDSLTTQPVSDEELTRTITAYRTALAATAETGRAFAGYLLGGATRGITVEEDHARRERVAALELPAVRDEAPKLASLDNALIVVAGDPEIVKPQLAAIGLTDIEVVARERPPEAVTRDIVLPQTPSGSVVAPPAQRGVPGAGCDLTAADCVAPAN